MNKKIMILTITILTLIMVTTPLIGTVQALGKPKSGETFTLDPFATPPDDPTIVGYTEPIAPTEKFVGPDDSFRHAWGAYREFDYVGVLGEGVLSIETIYSVSKSEPNDLGGLFAEGHGTYKVILEITPNGEYGEGTLEGIARLNWEVMLPPPSFSYEEWWTMSLHGKGDLKGLNVFVEAYATLLNPLNPATYKHWWTTTTIMS